MANVTTRHIRDKFYTWLDVSSTQTPRAMCGARTREGLIGVPTITEQSLVVYRGKQPVWGWCPSCCYNAYQAVVDLDLDSITAPHIRAVYKKFIGTIERPAKSHAVTNGLPFTEKSFQRNSNEGRTLRSAEERRGFGEREICYLCRERYASVADHIIPRAWGGSDTLDNLGPACRPCNIKKSDMKLEEVIENFPNVKFPERFQNPLTV